MDWADKKVQEIKEQGMKFLPKLFGEDGNPLDVLPSAFDESSKKIDALFAQALREAYNRGYGAGWTGQKRAKAYRKKTGVAGDK